MHPHLLALSLAATLCPAPACFAQPSDPPQPSPAAQPDAPRDLADLLEPIRKKHRFPALAAAIVSSDRLLALGAGGVRAEGFPEPVTKDDLWHIGSCTKSMTATLCALLVADGTLSWDTTLAKALPLDARKMDSGYRKVTLEQLCTNRGGVPNDINVDGLWGKLWSHPGSPTEARRLILDTITARTPSPTPGTFEYSNGNFALAGLIAETATATPYEQLITERLFRPLGMTTAAFGAPGSPDANNHPDQPRGHTKDAKPQNPTKDGRGADNPPAISPAGRVHLSMADWAKYIQLHLRGSRGQDQRVGKTLLTAEMFKKLQTPPDDRHDYAMGWSRPQRAWAGPPEDRYVLTHNGSNTMWFCVVWIAPAKDFAVLVATNTGEDGGPGTDEAAGMLIGQAKQMVKGP